MVWWMDKDGLVDGLGWFGRWIRMVWWMDKDGLVDG